MEEQPSPPAQPVSMTAPPRWALPLLLLLTTLLYAFDMTARPLWEPDELRYAEIPREMRAGGDFLTPHLNGLPYYEKPPLHYWATAGAQALFGEADWVNRVVPCLGALLLVLAAVVLARRWWGPWAGLLAGVVQATSLGGLALAKLNLLDTTLAAALGWVLVALALALEGQRPRALLGAGVAAGLAVLSKGLIGVVLPGFAAFTTLCFTGGWRRLRPGLLVLAALVCVGVTAPWFVAMMRAHPGGPEQPGFLWFFFVHEHLDRFLTSVHGRWEPTPMYLPVVLGALFPWIPHMLAAAGEARGAPRRLLKLAGVCYLLMNLLYLLALGLRAAGLSGRSLIALGLLGFVGATAVVGARRRAEELADPEERRQVLLLAWALCPFLFFSAANSKLIPYVYPCFLPLAVLTGGWWARVLAGERPLAAVVRWATAALAVISGPALAVAGLVLHLRPRLFPVHLPVWLAAGVTVLLASAAVVWGARRSPRLAFATTLGWMLVLAPWGTFLMRDLPLPNRTVVQTARLLPQVVGPDDAVVMERYQLDFLYRLERPLPLLIESFSEADMAVLDGLDRGARFGLIGRARHEETEVSRLSDVTPAPPRVPRETWAMPIAGGPDGRVWILTVSLNEDLRWPVLCLPPAQRAQHFVTRRDFPALWGGSRRVWLALSLDRRPGPESPTSRILFRLLRGQEVWWLAQEGKVLLVTNAPFPRAVRLRRWEDLPARGPFRLAAPDG